MPLMRCERNGGRGWKWGKSGFCYLGKTAKAKARKQGKAIHASGYRGDADDEIVRKIANRRERMQRAGFRVGRQPIWLHPDPVEIQYRKALIEIVAAMTSATDEVVIPHLEGLVADRDASLGRADGWPEEGAQVVDTLKVTIDRRNPYPNPAPLARDIGEKTAQWNDKEWRKVMRATVGVDLLQSEPWLDDLLGSFTRQNVALIKSIQDQYVGRIEGMVQGGLAAGTRHENIAKNIRKQYGVTRNRAKLIARDQVAKLNGQITEARQTRIGITEYIWRTSRDERVRPDHASKEGQTFRWDKPPADTGHPGQDFQCRCTAEPVMDELKNEVEEQQDRILPQPRTPRPRTTTPTRTRKTPTAPISSTVATIANIKTRADIATWANKRDIANTVKFRGTRGWGTAQSEVEAVRKSKVIYAEMERMEKQYPGFRFPKVNHFYVTKVRRGRATLVPRSEAASISFSDEWGAKGWANIEDWQRRNKRPWDWIRAESHEKIVVRHEYAHILQGKFGIESNPEWVAIKAKYSRQWRRDNVSQYAGKKKIEFFSVAFAQYTSPHYAAVKAGKHALHKGFPKDIERFFDKVLEGKI